LKTYDLRRRRKVEESTVFHLLACVRQRSRITATDQVCTSRRNVDPHHACSRAIGHGPIARTKSSFQSGVSPRVKNHKHVCGSACHLDRKGAIAARWELIKESLRREKLTWHPCELVIAVTPQGQPLFEWDSLQRRA